MLKYVGVLLVGLSVVLNTGCSTLADAKAARGTGTVKTYDKEFDVVWNAVIDVITGSDLDLVSQNKSSGEILAQRSMTAFSYGENVAVFVEKIGNRVVTRVEVVNKRVLATNITAANWESRIFNELDKRL